MQAPADLTDASVAIEYYDKIVPLVDKQMADLAALRPDSSAKADWDAFMALQTQSRDILRELREAAAAGADTNDRDLIGKVGPTAIAVAEAAKKVGANACT